jgi:hypothetical protein
VPGNLGTDLQMSLCQSSLSELQRAEANILHEAGFIVKNTFIDEVATIDEDARLLRRAVTAPLPTHFIEGSTTLDHEDSSGWKVSGFEDPLAVVESMGSDEESTPTWADAKCGDMALDTRLALEDLSEVSTTVSDDSDLATLVGSDAGSSPASTTMSKDEHDEQPALAVLMKRECAFLRISSCSLINLSEAQSAKLSVKNVKECLRVCVDGLPVLKRHKWQQPLAWCAAQVLQRAGCPAFVRRGDLFAPLDTRENGSVVRVDLCASRAED